MICQIQKTTKLTNNNEKYGKITISNAKMNTVFLGANRNLDNTYLDKRNIKKVLFKSSGNINDLYEKKQNHLITITEPNRSNTIDETNNEREDESYSEKAIINQKRFIYQTRPAQRTNRYKTQTEAKNR